MKRKKVAGLKMLLVHLRLVTGQRTKHQRVTGIISITRLEVGSQS